jgi:hypothetical protein
MKSYKETLGELMRQYGEKEVGEVLIDYIVKKKYVAEDFLIQPKKRSDGYQFACKCYGIQRHGVVILCFLKKEEAEDFRADIISAKTFEKIEDETRTTGSFSWELKIQELTRVFLLPDLAEILVMNGEIPSEILMNASFIKKLKAKDLGLV